MQKCSKLLHGNGLLLGMGVLIGAILLMFHNASEVVLLFGVGNHVVFMAWFCVAGICCGLGIVLSLHGFRSFAARVQPRTVACTLMVGAFGIALYAMAVILFHSTVVLAIAGWLSGISGMAAFVLWGVLFSRVAPDVHVRCLAVDGVLGAALFFGFSFLPARFQAVAAFALFVLSEVALLVAVGGAPARAEASSRAHGSPCTNRKLLASLWKAVLGVFLCAYIFGLTWDPTLARIAYSRPAIRLDVLLGACVASLALVAITRRGNGRLGASANAILPVASAVILVLPFIESDGVAWLSVLTGCIREASFILIVYVLWMSCTEVVIGHRDSVPRAYALGLSIACAGILVGILSIPYLGLSGQVVSLVCLTAYLAALAISLALPHDVTLNQPDSRAGTPNEQPCADVEEAGVRPHDGAFGADRQRYVEAGEARELFDADTALACGTDPVADACARMACSAKLSPREVEVFNLLARGHTQSFIAKELGVSNNTIRTHVRHIYCKIGASSREDLLALVEGCTRGVEELAVKTGWQMR